MAHLDSNRFGGDARKRFPPTGFFRVACDDGRWWFVTPDGCAFLSWGVNHAEPVFATAPYNAAFWEARFGGPAGSQAWRDGFTAKVQSDLARLGMNTLGAHSPVRHHDAPWCAYVTDVRSCDVCHWQRPGLQAFRDVFSEDFARHCAGVADAKVTPRRDDPLLLGYYLTDCPILTDLEAAPRAGNLYGAPRPGTATWPTRLRNLGPDAPGKRAYVGRMRERYHDARAFDRVYGTDFGDFEALARAADWRPGVDPYNAAEHADDAAFLLDVLDKRYQVEFDAIRRCDPNHLVFGDALNGNTDLPDDVVSLAARHADVLFYQHYDLPAGHRSLIERWSRLTDKPLFLADSAVASPTDDVPDPFGPHLPGPEARARAAVQCLEATFSHPRFVGWNWCGWIDSHAARQPVKQHSGLQDARGRFEQPIADALRAFGGRMYDVATI